MVANSAVLFILGDHYPLAVVLCKPLMVPFLSKDPSGPLTYRVSTNISEAILTSRSSRRLYIGNLHPSVSEYDLAQLFSPFGKLSRLELVFHKSGPSRGKPKGFAFLEYTRDEDALRAKIGTEGKEWKGGRKLNVGFANVSDEGGIGTSSTGPIRRTRRENQDDVKKPTTLSLIKNAQRPQGGTDARIAAMEAKLQALKKKREGPRDDESATSAGSPVCPTTLLKQASVSAGLPFKPLPPSKVKSHQR